MKTNPILEEGWRTKDELAREAGYDVHRFFVSGEGATSLSGAEERL